MTGDFPFLHEGPEEEGEWNGEHAENDNITPDQFLIDQVMGAADLFFKAKGMDSKDYFVEFNIDDTETHLGKTQPVFNLEDVTKLLADNVASVMKHGDTVTSMAAIIPTLQLAIQAANMPEPTKELLYVKLETLTDIFAVIVDHSMAANIVAKELVSVANTSSYIETKRYEQIRNQSGTKGGNNLIGPSSHNRDVQ